MLCLHGRSRRLRGYRYRLSTASLETCGGLLDEVVSFGFSAYSSEKMVRESVEDPVEELRWGWDLHVGFGLANPALYKLMYGDPVPGSEPTAAVKAFAMLRDLVHRIAQTGRLRVGEERATSMIHAAAMGATLTLIGQKPEDRDIALSETIPRSGPCGYHYGGGR